MGTDGGAAVNTLTVLNAYKVCALWSSIGDDEEPLDASHDIGDIAPATANQMREDVEDFLRLAAPLIQETGLDAEQVGHDFWLTRNGHGAGFWDRGLGEAGERLSDIATQYGGVDLYIGDDGLVHG